jgi:hypothetical protein
MTMRKGVCDDFPPFGSIDRELRRTGDVPSG